MGIKTSTFSEETINEFAQYNEHLSDDSTVLHLQRNDISTSAKSQSTDVRLTKEHKKELKKRKAEEEKIKKEEKKKEMLQIKAQEQEQKKRQKDQEKKQKKEEEKALKHKKQPLELESNTTDDKPQYKDESKSLIDTIIHKVRKQSKEEITNNGKERKCLETKQHQMQDNID